jgi:hypothetical protein
MIREQACADIVRNHKDTEDRKQTRRTEEKQEEAEDDFGQVEPATTQTSLPEEGTMLRGRSFSRLFGRVRRHKGGSKTESSETYDSSAIVGEGQKRTALPTEARQVQEAPHSAFHRKLRGIMPNESSDDEMSSDDSTMIPGAVRIPGANATVDDDDDQTTFFETSTAAPPELVEPRLVEAELALNLDEEIALGVKNTLQQAVQATAVPVRRKPWRRIICGIASVLILALVTILTQVFPLETSNAISTKVTSTPSETPSSSPTVERYTYLQNFLAPYLGDGFPMSETEQEALNWLAYNATVDSLSTQLLERYIVVLFYYETSGDSWNLNAGWLSEGTICFWHGVSCFRLFW